MHSGILCNACRPAAFDKDVQAQPASIAEDMLPPLAKSDESSDNDDMPPLHQNNNRQVIYRHEEPDSSDDENL